MVRPFLREYTKEVSTVEHDLSKLRDKISATVMPLRVAEATSNAEELYRIWSQLDILNLRIENCCLMARLNISQKLDTARIDDALSKILQLLHAKEEDCKCIVGANSTYPFDSSIGIVESPRTEAVFLSFLKLSPQDMKTMHEVGRLDLILIPDSLFFVGRAFLHGWKVSQCDSEAVRFLKLASDFGFAEARHTIGLMRFSKFDFEGAAEHWIVASEMGHCYSMLRLALLYLNGDLGAKNRYKGICYLEMGVQKGDAECEYCLVLCILTGTGIEKNGRKAFRMATAAKSNPCMKAIIAGCYLFGIGTTKNSKLGLAALSKSVPSTIFYCVKTDFIEECAPLYFKCLRDYHQLDESTACLQFNHWYSSESREESMYSNDIRKWCRRAADLGSPHAQWEYALFCENGWFADINESDAFRYYHKAAKQGDAYSSIRVARFYFEGKGVPHNIRKTKYWLRKASKYACPGIVEEVMELRNMIE